MAYEFLTFDVADRIATITVNRPDKLNALNDATIVELGRAIDEARGRDDVGAVILTGTGRAFIAGADISELSSQTPVTAKARAQRGQAIFRRFETSPKPTVSAVNGFALGGGCELAMACHIRVAAVSGFALGGGCELALHCDMIVASETAEFGQPEILLGIIPGAGGTQRLTRAVGKAKAMDLNLTGRMMDAAEAERCGLVARLVPAASLMDEAMKAAETIASMSLIAVMTAKEAVNRAFETTLAEGIRFERRTFQALFATHDQKEGMAAFIEKRPAKFEDR
jgi:enoyl-CoA hydratase/carnithine racemase